MEGGLPKIRTAVFLLQYSGVILYISFTLLLLPFSLNLQDKVLVYKCIPSGSSEQKDCPLSFAIFREQMTEISAEVEKCSKNKQRFLLPYNVKELFSSTIQQTSVVKDYCTDKIYIS